MPSFEQQPKRSSRRYIGKERITPTEQPERAEVSGEREMPKSPAEQVQRFLFQSQQFGDEAKMLANELPKFIDNGLMTDKGLQQYRSRLTELVAYLDQCVGYAEQVIKTGAPAGTMDQLQDGIVRDQEIIARAKEALAESERLAPKMSMTEEGPKLYKDRGRSPWEERLPESPWQKKEPQTEAQKPKKSFWSKLNPKSWFKKS